jgi:RNA polymerase sigma-B factor
VTDTPMSCVLEPDSTTSLTAVREPAGARGDRALLRRYARTRDPRLREELVHRYLPLARWAASQYARGSEPFDDLLQVASLGLLKAIDRYDPDNGSAFSSYAIPTMTGELRRHFRDRSWAVRPPRDLQEQALAVEKATTKVQRELGRSPTVDELCAATGLGHELLLEARTALGARSSTPLSTGEDDTGLDRRFGILDDGYASAEERAWLGPLLRHLPIRDRTVLRLRFEKDLTQHEIGAIVGLSQMHVSRVLRSALDALRAETTAADTTIGDVLPV